MISESTYDLIIIGGGIVGLATAREFLLKLKGFRVLILEAEDQIGKHQTSHNSGVLHSGIYYQPNSVKSKNCLRGYSLMLNYLVEQAIPHQICGKIIVAKKENELEMLQKLYENGLNVGLDKIRILTDKESSEMQPGIKAVKSLWVPYTGIVSYLQVAGHLEKEVILMGGKVLLGQKVINLALNSNQEWVVTTSKDVFRSKYVISCAGLQADRIIPNKSILKKYRIIPFKGDYYALMNTFYQNINHLLYPVPDPVFPFLGIHFTCHIDGSRSLGPNAVISLNRSDYKNHSINIGDLNSIITFPGFWKFVRRYWRTGLKEMMLFANQESFVKEGSSFGITVRKSDLSKMESGIRALVIDNQGYINDDFILFQDHNCLHVLNAPSPAATASLAIAETIYQKLISGLNTGF